MGGSVFIWCRFLWHLVNNSSFHIESLMYDGVVVLTNVLYIFLLVWLSPPTPRSQQGKEAVTYASRCSSLCWSRFRRKDSFIKVFHQSKNTPFFAVTTTKIEANSLGFFSLSSNLMWWLSEGRMVKLPQRIKPRPPCWWQIHIRQPDSNPQSGDAEEYWTY